MIEQRSQRRELAPDRGGSATTAFQMFAPGEQMRAGDFPKLRRFFIPKNTMNPDTSLRYARRVFGLEMLANHSSSGGTSLSR